MKTDEVIGQVTKFMKAQQEAEEMGKQEFSCPLCGGLAVWGRAQHNNHLHCGCKDCGFHMME